MGIAPPHRRDDRDTRGRSAFAGADLRRYAHGYASWRFADGDCRSLRDLGIRLLLLIGYLTSERCRFAEHDTHGVLHRRRRPGRHDAGFLLARAGSTSRCWRARPDFLRDFRGDTIHPSTLEVMHGLDCSTSFSSCRPEGAHASAARSAASSSPSMISVTLPTRCKFIALMPAWDFLNFLADHGKQFPNFHTAHAAEACRHHRDSGRVAGVRARAPEGEDDIRADSWWQADGRHSIMRQRAGLQ